MKKLHSLGKFANYNSIEALAKALRCSVEALSPPLNIFKQHKIPKKNSRKGFRIVWRIESQEFKDILKTFEVGYFNFIKNKLTGFPLSCIHGFLEKKSIFTNAKQHLEKSILLKADIKNFFDSITIELLEEHFLEINPNKDIAQALSKMLTIQGSLPQGFCTSPLMSNIIFFKLDLQFLKLAEKYNCIYTRYADDITFSSNKETPSQLEISEILYQKKFQLEHDKFRRKKRGQAFYVTGLSVSDSKPRVPREWKRGLRQELHFVQKFGFKKHAGKKNYPSEQSCINKLSGKINFLKSIEPELAKQLDNRLQNQLKHEDKKVGYISQNTKVNREIFFYIDEYFKDGCFFLCLVVVEKKDALSFKNSLKQINEDMLADDFLPQKEGALKKGILHWNDLSINARSKVINFISALPFRAYVNCALSEKMCENTYLNLLDALLKKRFTALDSNNITMYIEKTNLIKSKELQKVSDKIYLDSEKNLYRRPATKPVIKLVAKEKEINLAFPDFLLGVLGDYLFNSQEKEGKLTHIEANYKSLLPKYRCIQVFSKNKKTTFTNRDALFKSGFLDLRSSFT